MSTAVATTKCPRCGSDTCVVETRGPRRRRQCLECAERMTTHEIMGDDGSNLFRDVATLEREVKDLRRFRSAVFRALWPDIQAELTKQSERSET